MSYYLPLIAVIHTGYWLSIAAIFVFDGILPLTLACLALTFFTVQQAGLMHDGGHRAAFSSKRLNELMGLVSGASIGMVLANWRQRHNAHHAHPNQEGLDPDIEIPFLALDAAGIRDKDRLQRAVLRWQAFYYYPLGSLVGVSNRLGSISYFLRNPFGANLWRLALYVPIMLLMFVAPFVFFSLEKAVFVLLLVNISTGIYLASCFAPNHKAMATLSPDDRLSFLEQQVVTTRSVSGGLLTDILLVGLNHQIEHHLFPTCPRNKLRRLRPYVIRVCEEMGIEFLEESFIETNRSILRRLRAASASAA